MLRTQSRLLAALLLGGFLFVFALAGTANAYGATPPAAGDQVTFFVDSSYDIRNRSQVSATLLFVGSESYIFVENEYFNRLSPEDQQAFRNQAKSLQETFDTLIEPRLAQLLGTPWTPGIDNDPKITILFQEIDLSAGGYVNTANEFPRSTTPNSNEREMVYLNVAAVNSPRLKSFLAHEFQHLITFGSKERVLNKNDDIWLNELRSEVAPSLLGFDDPFSGSNLERRLNAFLQNPFDPLAEWKNAPADYATVNLFSQYLLGRFGQTFFQEMLRVPSVGMESFDAALRAVGSNAAFLDVFRDWVIASVLNDSAISDGRWGYADSDLRNFRVSPNATYGSGAFSLVKLSVASSMKDWAPQVYRFSEGDGRSLKVTFLTAVQPNAFQVPYIFRRVNQSVSEISVLTLTNGSGTVFLPDFGREITEATFVPMWVGKRSNFSANDPAGFFSFSAEATREVPKTQEGSPMVVSPQVFTPSFPDGSLIRANNDFKVYIVKGRFRRHILDAKIFSFYPHLGFEKVNVVSPEAVAAYEESFWVRADGDPKVYEVNGDKSRHWLNMTAEEFTTSGRVWDAVYIINKVERDFYALGADVKFTP